MPQPLYTDVAVELGGETYNLRVIKTDNAVVVVPNPDATIAEMAAPGFPTTPTTE